MEEEVDSGNRMVERDGNTGSLSHAKPKRLRSKVWDDFTPIFVGGKVEKAECMHCHQIFKSNSSSGTSNLLKHQATCSPQPQKKLMQRTGSDPTQKKLSFVPISQKKFSGTMDARPEKKDLDFLDIPNDTNQKSEEVNQNASHKEHGAPEQNDLAMPDVPTDMKTKIQQVEDRKSVV